MDKTPEIASHLRMLMHTSSDDLLMLLAEGRARLHGPKLNGAVQIHFVQRDDTHRVDVTDWEFEDGGPQEVVDILMEEITQSVATNVPVLVIPDDDEHEPRLMIPVLDDYFSISFKLTDIWIETDGADEHPGLVKSLDQAIEDCEGLISKLKAQRDMVAASAATPEPS